MSQPNHHANNASPKYCIKCKAIYGTPQFQGMCSPCYLQKNQQPAKQPMTPIKRIQRIQMTKRQNQLLKAPKKAHEEQESESGSLNQGSQEEDGEEELDEYEDYMQRRVLGLIKEEQSSQGEQNSNEYEQPQTNQVSLKHQVNQDQINQNTTFKIIAKHQAYKKPILIIRHNHQVKIQELEEPICKRNFTQFLDEREDLQVIKGKCRSCSKRTGLLGVNCRHCGHQYCNSHRLPQNHQCKVDFVGQFKEKRRQEMLQLMQKHKGKVRQI